ncbi:glycosyl transferase family 2 [Kineococcus xinjiangensis]|uniref:Glycosyl transferase family 2 n=1 Tax=Kineococcus xinjiangensis TaxID=512762 RepID=A0A2S6IT62_9ACTN|nr:glycosyltransferase family A protein [Kineococcus xinjiangensis]PPK97236.1 glycosyl transferase family 2 [Kineococcus xinjiangensis]
MASPRRFTILCATYNQADYLEEMLSSALAQDFEDFEVVVVDDGSTDATPEVLQRVLAQAPADVRERVVVERTANGGQTAAYERGFALSSGEYVCLLDSDDRFHPGKLRELDRVTREDPGAGMVMHPLCVIGPTGAPTGIVRPQGAAMTNGDARAQMRRNARHVAPGASGLVFRRDVMAQMFPAPTKGFPFAADAYLSFGAACLAPVRALSTPLADYRMQPGGQYLRRMLSPEGLRRQLEFQEVVAGHFGLGEAARRNSLFARNRYASAMYEGTGRRRLREFRDLEVAVLTDPFFSPRQKALLGGFWLTTLVAGPRRFPALWEWFQRRQTGWHRIAAQAERSGATQ